VKTPKKVNTKQNSNEKVLSSNILCNSIGKKTSTNSTNSFASDSKTKGRSKEREQELPVCNPNPNTFNINFLNAKNFQQDSSKKSIASPRFSIENVEDKRFLLKNSTTISVNISKN